MSDDAQIAFAQERYLRAVHAVQSGIAFLMSQGDPLTEPKHMRAGLDTAKAEMGGLVGLLIKKGVITELEYALAMADAAEAEKARFEAHIAELTGHKVTLA